MPAKMGTCCRKEKGVLVTVYVEKPNRRTFTNHNHRHHHTIAREVIHYRHGAGGKAYFSRRAELLQYSQHLRQSARSAPASIPSKPWPNHTNHNQQPHAQTVAVRRKPDENSKAPTCFGNWKISDVYGFLTSFQAKKEKKTRMKRSGSTCNKVTVAIKSFKVQKQRGLFSKVFSAKRK